MSGVTFWGMKLNASETKTMIVSKSRTMHSPQSPPLTIGWTVLKEPDNLVILGVTFDSKMTFEKHPRSVSRAASQILGILRKSWLYSMIDRFLGVFQSFVLPVLEYCSAVWCSAADTHLKLLDQAVSGARFLTGGVFECDISHRRSVAVQCMLFKIRCNPVHPLNGALPEPYVPVRVTRSTLVAHWFTSAPPRCRTLQCSRTFIRFSGSLWNDRANSVFDGLGLAGFNSRTNASLLA